MLYTSFARKDRCPIGVWIAVFFEGFSQTQIKIFDQTIFRRLQVFFVCSTFITKKKNYINIPFILYHFLKI